MYFALGFASLPSHSRQLALPCIQKTFLANTCFVLEKQGKEASSLREAGKPKRNLKSRGPQPLVMVRDSSQTSVVRFKELLLRWDFHYKDGISYAKCC